MDCEDRFHQDQDEGLVK